MLCSDLPTLVVLGTEWRVFTGRSEAPTLWDLGKALRLLLAHQIFLSGHSCCLQVLLDWILLQTQTQLFQSVPQTQPWATWRNISLNLTQRKQSQRKEWNSLLETSALTLHTGKDPKESSGERNETICWTEVQFYSPFDMIFFLWWRSDTTVPSLGQ